MQELAGMKVYSLKDVCKLLKIGPKKGLELFNNNEKIVNDNLRYPGIIGKNSKVNTGLR